MIINYKILFKLIMVIVPSLSDLTFIPPVILTNVSLPDISVTCKKVSLKVARMCATPKTNSLS